MFYWFRGLELQPINILDSLSLDKISRYKQTPHINTKTITIASKTFKSFFNTVRCQPTTNIPIAKQVV